MQEPKQLITRFFEAAVIFCIAAWLIKLGVCYLSSIWVKLLIIGAVIIAIIIFYRIGKFKKDNRDL